MCPQEKGEGLYQCGHFADSGSILLRFCVVFYGRLLNVFNR